MFEELDEFSRKVAFQVFERFPQWEPLAGIDEYDGEKALLVKLPPPSGDPDTPLTIDTFREEVTVAFDAYHAHFCDYDDTDIEAAFSLVNQIVSDELAVVSYWRDEKWCGSMLLHHSEFPSTNEEYPYANIIRIRSWSGQYDREITCIPKD